MISTMAINQAQRRVQTFQQRCGEYGEAALHLAYHAALPVALNAELLHLLRINFFLDPPEILPYTVEFEFLLSPLCREIDEGLYEIEPDIRDVLLAGLNQTYNPQRTRAIATLLWQYVDRHSPWSDRVELERAQQLTALHFLNPEKAQQWLVTVETEVNQGQVAAREWFVAMRQDIENQAQLRQNEEIIDLLPQKISSMPLLSIGIYPNNLTDEQKRTLQAIFTKSPPENLLWKRVQDLLEAMPGFEVKQFGDRLFVKVTSEEKPRSVVFHTPSKQKHAASEHVRQIRDFLETIEQARADEKTISTLLAALNDNSSEVRSSAAKALGQIGDTRAVSALLKALKDKNRTVRSTAAEALAQMGHHNVIDVLVDRAIDQLPDELPQRPKEQNQLGQNVPLASLRSLSTPQMWTFQNEVMQIGRAQDNDLVLPELEGGISRQHAEISRRYSADNADEPTYFLRDFSRFGTWVLLPETEEWQKIHQQEIVLSPGTQLKFGSSKNLALEFLITEPEVSEIFRQFQTSLVHGREAIAWLNENLTQLAETGARLALEQFPDIKEAASPEQVDEFHFSIEQFLEQISHCLTWGSYDVLDELETPVIFENKVYETAFRKIKKRLPAQLNDDAKEQLINCIDYLIEVLVRDEKSREKEDQDEFLKPGEALLRESRRAIQVTPQPVQVFVSYARKDEVFYNQLVEHLSVLRRGRVIAAWHDRCSRSEKEREELIDPFLESADIILFLISADFLASDTSREEVARAIERHDAGEARVLPIILRPVDLQDFPLSHLQVLPKNAKPITAWGNRNEAFLNVIQGIREAAEQIMARSQPASKQLSPEQRRRLEKRRAELQEQLSLLNRQLQHLRRGYAIETNAAMRLLFQQIEAIDLEIEQLESSLESLE